MSDPNAKKSTETDKETEKSQATPTGATGTAKDDQTSKVALAQETKKDPKKDLKKKSVMDDKQLQKLIDGFGTKLSTTLSSSKPSHKEQMPTALEEIDPVKWKSFLAQFKNLMVLNAWEADRAKLILQTSVTEAAGRAVEHISFDKKDTVDEALEKYGQVFINPASQHLYRAQFEKAQRDSGEELIMWHTRLRELFSKAYPDEVGRTMEKSDKLKQRFVMGIRDKSISLTLHASETYQTATYTELLTRAQNYQGTALLCSSSYGSHVSAIEGQQDRKDRYAIQALSKPGPGDKRFRSGSVQCYNCRKYGHIARECRQRPNNNRRSNTTRTKPWNDRFRPKPQEWKNPSGRKPFQKAFVKRIAQLTGAYDDDEDNLLSPDEDNDPSSTASAKEHQGNGRGRAY